MEVSSKAWASPVLLVFFFSLAVTVGSQTIVMLDSPVNDHKIIERQRIGRPHCIQLKKNDAEKRASLTISLLA